MSGAHVIRSFTLRTLRKNRTRTVVTIAGIALSAALLTAVLTVLSSLTSFLYEQEAAAQKRQQEYSRLSPEVQKVIEAGDEYVKKIREANDAIPGEEISAKIYRMETLVDRIFDRVEQKPDTVGDIRKLMEYYLPTTIKLLEAYEELDAQPVQGENIISSKQEIEKTLDTLNAAFEKLLDDLFQDTAWDLSSDISVLNTMLAQEGLTEDGLNTGGRK